MILRFCLSIFCLFMNSHATALSQEKSKEWLEDINVYGKELESRHIDLYHTIEKKEFKKQLMNLKAKLADLNEYQVIIKLMELTRRIGNGLSDGHTAIPLWNRSFHEFPFEIMIKNNHVLVIGTTDIHKNMLGSKLKSINGVPVEEIIQKFEAIVPFVENSYSAQIRVGHKLLIPELLFGFGFLEGLESANFVFENENVSHKVKVSSITADEYKRGMVHKISYQKLESFQKITEQSKALWLASLDQGKTVYIYFRLYPSMTAMQSFAVEALEYINKHQTENLIVDFRDSFGGNGFVGLKLAEYLVQADSINWKNGVYTLISNKTFSAAMNNSIQFGQLLNAKLVGQPSGARPSGYQDMGQFQLPNSNLLVTYSKRLFDFPDKDVPSLFPEVLIPLYLSDYVDGRDRTLEWVFEDIKSASDRTKHP